MVGRKFSYTQHAFKLQTEYSVQIGIRTQKERLSVGSLDFYFIFLSITKAKLPYVNRVPILIFQVPEIIISNP